jgi:lipoprotein-releasing system permease protein
MGADDKLISRIFLFEGWMIAGFGALIGIVIGIILCLIQQEFGLA